MAREGATLDFNTSPELAGWLRMNAAAMQAAEAAAGEPVHDYSVETPQSTWQNGWSFQGMGVPSFEVSAGGKDYDLMYHSTYEVQSELDWDYMARIGKTFGAMFRSMDSGVLPYDFAARGEDLTAAVDADELAAAGVKAADAATLVSAAASLETRGATWNRLKYGLARTSQQFANRVLLAMASQSLSGFQALDAWDYDCYPHQQTMWDIENMDAALAHLQADPVEADAAIESLTAVGVNWYATLFSPGVVNYDLTRHDPDYNRVTWGAMGKQINHFDMAPVWALIRDGQYDKAIAKVQKMRAADALDLRMRVGDMAWTSTYVSGGLGFLNHLARQSQTNRAKDSAVKEGIHSIQVGIQSWAVDHHDRYPKPSTVDRKGLGAYVDDWPFNPFTGTVMQPGTHRGDYTYRVVDGGRSFRLIGHLSNGGRYVVP